MSIKVGVRVRPFNSREIEKKSELVIEMPGNNQTKIKDELGREKTFTFDHSFWSHDGFRTEENGYLTPEDDKYADQQLVFDAVGKQILDNAWEGYHCCLFAYGQTGSGKSYSMVGYGANKGIVPISCDEIFKRIEQNKDEAKSFQVQVSMLEIYNEKVQDLLIPADKRPQGGLKVRESKVLGIFVEGLTKHPVTSYKEISNKMDEGYRNRTIGSTLMNATSSRAHTIVIIEFRQVTTVGKRKSEKLSMINLVDLAGSERAGSTGATGDRLKEGCNINKSLLVLGNVINALADKAIGKKKNVLPPYRDSALTRILQNALGGNSKTVMICALSPADCNYEETLSTLRYADRAKKIQNKAVINESEQDKMIRLLKDENTGLKKMIEDLQKKLLGKGGVVEEEDKKAFLELKEQYEANQRAMTDMQKSFEEKLEEAKKNEGEHIGGNVDLSLPHLVVLHEDPQLSHKLRYPLVSLPVHVGRKQGNPPPEIVLSGIGIMQNHAIFLKQGEEIVLKSNDKQALKYIYVNGRKISADGQILANKDRIVLGTNCILLFMKTSTGDDIYSVDWESAQMELQKEIEIANKKENEENEKRKQEEINLIKKGLEEEYAKKKNEMDEQLRKKMEEYQLQLKEINQNAERQRIEQERLMQEKKLKEKIEQLEEEKARKKRELKIREKNELIKQEQMKKEQEFIHKSAKLENTLNNILKKISKIKIIINELKRNINLEVTLHKNFLEAEDNSNSNSGSTSTGSSGANIMIRVENFEEGSVYYWNTETFHNRYDLMKEMFNKYNDEDFDILHMKNDDDPLWDQPQNLLMGYAFYKLEPIGYLMGNESEISIISPGGEIMGDIVLDVIPHDENGNEYDEVPETPFELIGQSLLYKVSIIRIKNLRQNFCKNLYVEYQSFYDHSVNQTKIYNKEGEEKKTDLKINECFEHKIDYLTKDDIEIFEKEKLCFKIYANEEVEKKGKTPIEEILGKDKDEELPEPKENIISIPTHNKADSDFLNVPSKEIENIKQEVLNTPNKKTGKSNHSSASSGKKDCVIY